MSERLTNREKEIFELIAQGFSNKEICEKLYISITTMTTHYNNIIHKFGIYGKGANRVKLALIYWNIERNKQ